MKEIALLPEKLPRRLKLLQEALFSVPVPGSERVFSTLGDFVTKLSKKCSRLVDVVDDIALLNWHFTKK